MSGTCIRSKEQTVMRLIEDKANKNRALDQTTPIRASRLSHAPGPTAPESSGSPTRP
jgi:hypothetical protein